MSGPVASTTILIDAPLARVWEVVLDFSRYGAWNPFVIAVEDLHGPPAPGVPFALRVRWASGRTLVTRERFTSIEPPAGDRARLAYRFDSWAHRLGLVRAEREQLLQRLDDGRTRYDTSERFGGLLARLVPLSAVQDGFERQARALKARAESPG